MTKLHTVPKIVIMKRRYIEEIIKTLALKNNKMAFISGPRQSGKTTLAKILMTEESTQCGIMFADVT